MPALGVTVLNPAQMKVIVPPCEDCDVLPKAVHILFACQPRPHIAERTQLRFGSGRQKEMVRRYFTGDWKTAILSLRY